MPLGQFTASVSRADLTYTGRELRPHFLLEKFGVRGSGVVAFTGPCRVETAELVDWEDRIADDFIGAARMLHFLGEFFGMRIETGVFLQRLWISICSDILSGLLLSVPVERRGDDLFVRGRKLSVSIVTASPVSCLLHLGINLDPTGAPTHVPVIGLKELGISDQDFLGEALERFSSEWREIEWACVKVRPVV